MPRRELFVGSLSRDVERKDMESVFEKYGRLIRCDIKNRGFGAAYCFLEFEDERDAEDALNAENGKNMLGSSMVVEFAKGKRDRESDRRRYDDRRSRYGGRGGRGGRTLDCYSCGQEGHFARDCRKGRDRRGGRDRSRDRRSRDRRSRDRRSRDRKRKDSRSRSRDSDRRSRSEGSDRKSRSRS